MTWLEVFEAQRAHNSPGNYLQLATVDAEGRPSMRTVVLRGFTRAGEPWFFTDARSSKVEHLRRTPAVALLAWWQRTEDQFRLEGRATLHGLEATGEAAVHRHTSWQRLGDRRSPFLGPAPGSLLGAATSPPITAGAPPPNFVVVTVTVARVDWLRLGAVHRRVRYSLTGTQWLREELVP